MKIYCSLIFITFNKDEICLFKRILIKHITETTLFLV